MWIYEGLHSLLWNRIMLPAVLFLGGWLLIKSRFYPLLRIRDWMGQTVGSLFSGKGRREKKAGSLSGFQAACTALAASLGTGNIAGVATALTAGGPGAIFWMWVSGLLGMMLQYAEIALGARYQKREADGRLTGGPMYYMEDGLGRKGIAKLYAALCVLASFGIGNMTQANSMAQGLWESFSVPPLLAGTVCCALVGIALSGGVKRIGRMAERMIPLVSCLYIGASLLFLLCRMAQLPEAFGLIFQKAFQLRSCVGGIVGYSIKEALTLGLSRGTFSHEAGMGSAAIAHGAAEGKLPAEQGLWGIFQVFFDTIVMCTVTALVILTSGVYEAGPYGEMVVLTGSCGSFLDGAALTAAAFGTVLGKLGEQLVAVSLALFAFSTLLAWACYGELCFQYLFGRRFAGCYRFIYLLAIPLGSAAAVPVIWQLSDICNGLMALPNLLALWLLRREIGQLIEQIRKK